MKFFSRNPFRRFAKKLCALCFSEWIIWLSIRGARVAACEADGIASCAQSLKIACKGLRLGSLRILLENTAGQGECIGHRFEHLREIMDLCPKLPLGVCFDTAHAFTAGYDIREEDGLEALIQKMNRQLG